MQNTEETIAKYVVDANLFRLSSTNSKKKYPAPGFFMHLLFFKKNFYIQNKDFFSTIFFSFFKSVQIYMKNVECTETNIRFNSLRIFH